MSEIIAMIVILITLYVMDRVIYCFVRKEDEYELNKEGRSKVSVLPIEARCRNQYGKRSIYQIHKMRLLQKIILCRHKNRNQDESIATKICREQWKKH